MNQLKNASITITHKFLNLFTVIHPDEFGTALLLMLNISLLVTAISITQAVRTAFIVIERGPEWGRYLSAAIVVLLIFVVKIFSRLASHLPRQKLISFVIAFFISNLVVFYFLSYSGIPKDTLGILFFICIGICNVTVIALFWGFANDLYDEEKGKRLFPLVAFGAIFGGFMGGAISNRLIPFIGIYQLILVSGGILGICIILTQVIHRREVSIGQVEQADSPAVQEQEKPLEKGGGFQLQFKKRYLLYIAIFILLLNFINSNGQYMLHDFFERASIEAVESGTAVESRNAEYLLGYLSKFTMYASLLAIIIQLFAVSRIFRWLGVRAALFIFPIIALGGYILGAMGVSLMLIQWVKMAEISTRVSIMNTTHHALFLVTTREEKYKAKFAIDTFFSRSGKLLSALLVFLGTTYFAFEMEHFGAFNIGLVIILLVLGVLIFLEHKKLSAVK